MVMQLFKLMWVVMGNKQSTNVGLMYKIASLFCLTGRYYTGTNLGGLMGWLYILMYFTAS